VSETILTMMRRMAEMHGSKPRMVNVTIRSRYDAIDSGLHYTASPAATLPTMACWAERSGGDICLDI
jgi:hypothetical protein